MNRGIYSSSRKDAKLTEHIYRFASDDIDSKKHGWD